jgi:hypothetical protein
LVWLRGFASAGLAVVFFLAPPQQAQDAVIAFLDQRRLDRLAEGWIVEPHTQVGRLILGGRLAPGGADAVCFWSLATMRSLAFRLSVRMVPA